LIVFDVVLRLFVNQVKKRFFIVKNFSFKIFTFFTQMTIKL
jgi:hypothetical protein